jgi:hypothetical protein
MTFEILNVKIKRFKLLFTLKQDISQVDFKFYHNFNVKSRTFIIENSLNYRQKTYLYKPS